MSARPDASALRDSLRRVSRRRASLAAVEGAALGLIVAGLAGWMLRPGATIIAGIALALVGAALAIVLLERRRGSVAQAIESRAPRCRNVVVTAAELIDQPAAIRPDIADRLFGEASRIVAALDPAALFPARRAASALAIGVGLWALALVLVTPRSALPSRPGPVPIDAVAIQGIEISITPPAYAGRPAQVVRDPERIEALAGSTIRLIVSAIAESVTVETVGGRRSLTAGEGRRFTGDIVADGDGFVAIEASATDGRPGARRLIGLAVTPDQPPRVRLTAPGRDLFLPDGNRRLDVAVESEDDLALATLGLRYTIVSGSGERFTFIDGETPIQIVRIDERSWRGRGTLPLDTMALGPGDVVVYRGIATDRRPGATPTESDAFLVEITSPGAVASEGFAMDDEDDRYAVSQQMVILKTERLIERRASMSPESIRDSAMRIAAEQRQVRAEFVFMMGGELAEEVTGAEVGISQLHEEAEAEASDDILAGRLANRGRIELIQAIRAMSEANASLVAMRVDSALVAEKLALDHLQRAFSRTRYILRALTERERLDPSRRLTGALGDAGRDVRPLAELPADARSVELRRVLAAIATLAAETREPRAESVAAATVERSLRAGEAARDVLRLDASDETLQRVAARLTDAATALEASRMAAAGAMLDSAAVELTSVLRGNLLDAPTLPPALDAARIEGALIDALRRPGGPG